MASDERVPIPDAVRLVASVLESSTGKDSFLHGEGHWRRVAAAGLALHPETPAADPAVVFLFALFHDSMRLNDGHDPRHGPRGAALAGELRGEAFDLMTRIWICLGSPARSTPTAAWAQTRPWGLAGTPTG